MIKIGFQKNLRYYREKAGYKQAKEFAEELGISYTTYIAYENQGREPKYNTLIKIADMLNVSLDVLLNRYDISDDKIKEIIQKSIDGLNRKIIKGSIDGLDNEFEVKDINISKKFIFIDMSYLSYSLPIYIYEFKLLEKFKLIENNKNISDYKQATLKQEFVSDIIYNALLEHLYNCGLLFYSFCIDTCIDIDLEKKDFTLLIDFVSNIGNFIAKKITKKYCHILR